MISKAKMRLLVAEDEIGIREPMAEYLIRSGYEVHTAENGIEALNLIRQHAYDLIILDIKMPYLDGYQLAEALKEEKIAVPILATTAVGMEGKLPGEIGRLQKIFTLKELGQKVDVFLKKNAK